MLKFQIFIEPSKLQFISILLFRKIRNERQQPSNAHSNVENKKCYESNDSNYSFFRSYLSLKIWIYFLIEVLSKKHVCDTNIKKAEYISIL